MNRPARRTAHEFYYAITNHPELRGCPAEFVCQGIGGCTLRLLKKWGKHPKGEEVYLESHQYERPKPPPEPPKPPPVGPVPASGPMSAWEPAVGNEPLSKYQNYWMEVRCHCGAVAKLKVQGLAHEQVSVFKAIARLRCRLCGGTASAVWLCETAIRQESSERGVAPGWSVRLK